MSWHRRDFGLAEDTSNPAARLRGSGKSRPMQVRDVAGSSSPYEDRVVLLNGVVKGAREATPPRAFEDALMYLDEYKRTGRVSPEEVDDE